LTMSLDNSRNDFWKLFTWNRATGLDTFSPDGDWFTLGSFFIKIQK
jgi:hypothetical protein